jgi:predicted regulator of Ras-like GTPase activity (Roadblock/LC7/MglB family)
VLVPLTTILPALPAEIRQSMNGLDPATRSFHVPLEEFETQIRSGKLRFKWSKLRGWCRPEPFAANVADVDVNLPLAELVPLFMARRKAPDSRKKIEIDSRIPDVFGKSGLPEPAPAPTPEPAAEPAPAPIPAAEAAPAANAPPEPIADPTPITPEPEPAPAIANLPPPAVEPEPEPTPEPEPAPVAETAPVPEPAPIAMDAPAAAPAPVSEAAPESVPFPMGGLSEGPAVPIIAPAITPFRVEQPSSGSSHQSSGPANPSAQALKRIRALDGVTGAFLATVDGLLIAAELPNGNENIMAAFAPTVFAQLAKYCDMAKLGLPMSIDLHLGLTNIHVRKAGKIFLGVLSSDGRPLPLPELNLIAATLQPNAS